MFNAAAHYEEKTTRREVVHLYNRVVLGNSGAIASQDSEGKAGFVVVKTSTKTGRYTCTLSGGKTVEILDGRATVVGADDAAYTTAKGLGSYMRHDLVATDGTCKVQMYRTDTGADAEVEDSRTLLFHLVIGTV